VYQNSIIAINRRRSVHPAAQGCSVQQLRQLGEVHGGPPRLVIKLRQNSVFVGQWNKSDSTTTGSILPATYTTRCAGNIRISSLSCVMHKAASWLATMGLRFRQPQQQCLDEPFDLDQRRLENLNAAYGTDSEAAKQLGVRYVLEGSVRKNGNASGSRRS
jgi:hypothetical protein